VSPGEGDTRGGLPPPASP